jgi:putative phosphoribosyl transferase
MKFRNRADGGRALATKLAHYANRTDVLVLGLPRGGVPVAAEVARALGAPIDIFVVRKLGVPGQEELAMGAIASGGTRVLNYHVVQTYDIDPTTVDHVTSRELIELRRREDAYRGSREAVPIAGRVAILVDDGLATGSTMRAAASAIRDHEPKAIVVAVPVAPASTCADLRAEVDEVICAHMPEDFRAVGLWYDDFTQTTDDEVREILASVP